MKDERNQRVREAQPRVLVLQEVGAAFTESKERSGSLQSKRKGRNKDQVRQALDTQSFTILSIRISRTLKQNKQNTSGSISDKAHQNLS